MKESIGSTASLNIMLAFIAIVFAFLAAALSYYKSFKINNVITNSIEKYEGYNDLAISEIDQKLSSLGYQRYEIVCSEEKKFNGKLFKLVDGSGDGYCIYHYKGDKYDEYGITTYMTVNLPIVSKFFKIPINTVTNEIYRCYGGVCDDGVSD